MGIIIRSNNKIVILTLLLTLPLALHQTLTLKMTMAKRGMETRATINETEAMTTEGITNQ